MSKNKNSQETNFNNKFGADILYGNNRYSPRSFVGKNLEEDIHSQPIHNIGWRLFSVLPQKMRNLTIFHNLQFGKRPITREIFYVEYGITLLGA